MKLFVHKIASVVHGLGIGKEVELLAEGRKAHIGDVVLVKAKAEKLFYGELELEEGRMAKIFRGDYIVGALGIRRALKGFVGDCPEELNPGDELGILNLGGVIGIPQAVQNPDLGSPCPVEFVGFVTKKGKVTSLASISLPEKKDVVIAPLVVVSGTCMAAGKTRAACEIIHELSSNGKRINSAKLSGVACRRDVLNMEDHGACRTASFLDCGLVSTVRTDGIANYAEIILKYLSTDNPDIIVLELGDGIFGEYGVLEILRSLKNLKRVHVLCATDPVGAWGAYEFLKKENIPIDIISGSCTDNIVGVSFVEEKLKLKAINAYTSPEILGMQIERILEKKS